MLVLMMVPGFELLMIQPREESGLERLLTQRLEEPEVELLMIQPQEESGLELLLIWRLEEPEVELLMIQPQESGLELLQTRT